MLSTRAVRLFLLGLVCAVAARAEAPVASLTKNVGGTKLHYLSAGHGPTVILLHGYAEASRIWRPLADSAAGRSLHRHRAGPARHREVPLS